MDIIIREDIDSIIKQSHDWEKLKNANILITGANGYLASYIVYSLLAADEKFELNIVVYALCRNKQKALLKFGEYIEQNNFKLIIQDVQDEIMGEYHFDYIVHAASPANPFIFRKNPYSVISANVIGFDKLLKKTSAWGTKKILLFSSYAVYGDTLPNDGAKETFRGAIDFTDIRYAYHLSKQMVEMMAHSFKKQQEIKISIVRPSIVYGPGMVYSQRKHVTDFVKNYLCDEDIELKSDGTAVRSFLYIRDATDAFIEILLQDIEGEFNVSSEKSVCSVRELAEIFTTFEKKLNVVMTSEERLNMGYLKTTNDIGIVSNNKIRTLGWRESVSLRDGIQRTIEWAERNQFMDI